VRAAKSCVHAVASAYFSSSALFALRDLRASNACAAIVAKPAKTEGVAASGALPANTEGFAASGALLANDFGSPWRPPSRKKNPDTTSDSSAGSGAATWAASGAAARRALGLEATSIRKAYFLRLAADNYPGQRLPEPSSRRQ
jgi:hypothetical protein